MNVMDVDVDAVAALSSRLALVVADVDAADLDASDHTIGRHRMHAEIPYVGFVTVVRRMPLIPRWGPESHRVRPTSHRYRSIRVEMCGMRARVEPLASQTSDNRVDYLLWDIEILPSLLVVRRSVQASLRSGEYAVNLRICPDSGNVTAVEYLLGLVDEVGICAVDAVSSAAENCHGESTSAV
jgi:hypothetical protein